MSFTFKERQKINHSLNKAGLASLENPRDLLSQIAMGIKTHRQFRSLLLTVTPDKRTECYESLKSRLLFTPKPLADYIIDGAEEAEALRLPVADPETGKLTAFEDYHAKPKSLHEIAQEAIRRKEREDEAKGSLELVCKACTFSEVFPAKDRIQAYADAKRKNWTFQKDGEEEKATCPKCSKKRLIH